MALASLGEASRVTASLRKVVLNELKKVTLLSYCLVLPLNGLPELSILAL